MSVLVKESAPANIALIKYMGKKDHQLNIPSNSSLSWTIDHLRTFIEIHPSEEGIDQWRPLEGGCKLELKPASVDRFMNFWQVLKTEMKIEGFFKVMSGNNFPFGCGLASSASSFAGLTRAAHQLSLTQGQPKLSIQKLSLLSSRGSGSSCRSLQEGWVSWSENEVSSLTLPYSKLIHKVVVVQDGEKKVSSSQAHKLITTSLLEQGRSIRAEKRLSLLLTSLGQKNWKRAYEICWSEFWDMHSLFETSQPPFGYMTNETLHVLNILRCFWAKNQDGPLVTMDAGPNIHLLFREDQQSCAQGIVNNDLSGFQVI